MNQEKILLFEKKLSPKRHRQANSAKFLFSFFFYLTSFMGLLFETAIASFFLLFFTFPALICFMVRKVFTKKSVFLSNNIYGKYGTVLTVRYFNTSSFYIHNLPMFFYVLTSKIQLVGPTIKKAYKDKKIIECSYIFNEKPGLFSLLFIRESTKIRHKSKICVEKEYLYRKNLFYDTLLILKTLPAFLYHNENNSYKQKINLFGIKFSNINMNEAMETITNCVTNNNKSSINFVNPDCFNLLFSDKEYFNTLKKTDYIFPDGIGIHIAGKIINSPLKQNINGTDMFPFVCELAQKNQFSFYFLGAKESVVNNFNNIISKKYPKLKIAGFHHGYFDKETESKTIIENINKTKTNILLVALGAPHQEKWIEKYKSELDCQVIAGVGGLFDFYSESVKRAPIWMRELGLEWLYRIFQEPKRLWKRYFIGNPLFLYRVLRWNYEKGDLYVN
jgi:N-acetylglucosaminyldiphosphoundecaprenol N-acetyl-beta-D-mannosaminyltransferase